MDQQQNRGPTTTRDLVAVVFRQKWVILTIFMVTTLSVVLLNLRTPTTYEAAGRVRVERGRKETTLQPNLRVLTWKEEISSELETVKSHPVSKEAQVILDAWYEDGTLSQPIRINRQGVGAGVIGESNVLDISYTSKDASVCRPVTAAVIEAYTRYRQASLAFPQVKSFFENESRRVKAELLVLQEQKERILAGIGPGSAYGREGDVGHMLQQCEMDILAAESRLSLVRQQHRIGRELAEADDIEATYFLQLKRENSWALNQMREQYVRARMLRDELSATFTPQHPELKRAESSLLSVEQMLRAEVQATVLLLAQEEAELVSQLAVYRSQKDALRDELTLIPQSRVEIQKIDAAIQMKQDEEKNLIEKQLLTSVNLATSPEFTVTIISPASSPYPKRTRDYIRIALAPLMSLVVGLLLAFFLDSLDHSLRNPRDVEDYLGVPVLASLPEGRR